MAINLGDLFFGLGADTRRLNAARSSVRQFANDTVRAAQVQAAAAQRAEERMRKLEQSIRRVADVSVLVAGPMSGVATRLNLISSVADGVSLRAAAMVVGLSAGVAAFGALAKAAIDTAKSVQRTTMALDSINNNITITQVQMADLMRVSDLMGANFSSTAQAFARFQAASVGTNLEGEQTRKIFQQMLGVSSKLGLSVEDTEGIFRALEQIMSKGTVQAEELRGQLGDRLPGAFNIMAEALGVTTQKLNELMKKGQVTSDALVKFAETAAKRMGVDLTQPIDSIVASEGRFANSLTRMNDQIDKSVGFSRAYVNILDAMTAGIDGLTNNIRTLLGPFGSLVSMIAGLNTSWQGWLASVANLNPITAFLNAIRGLTSAIFGLSEAETQQQQVANALGQAHVGAIPEVKAYIQAQSDLKYTIRDTTMEYIKQQEVFLQGLKNQVNAVHRQIQDAEHTLFSEEGGWMRNPLTGEAMRDDEAIRQAAEALPKYEANLKTLSMQVQESSGDLQKLNDILSKQTKIENARTSATANPLGAGTATKSAKGLSTALDEALDKIRETEQALAIQGLPKYLQEWARVQMDINKTVDDFRDKLVEAKVPIETINALTAKYASLTRQLKEGEYYIKTHTSAWEAFAGVMSRGMDTALNNFVDGMLEGQSMMETLRNTAKAVVADMIKTFMQLSVINPLKNALFGGDPSTGMPFMTLGGGLLGNLFKTPATFSTNTTLGGFLGANAGGTTGWRGGLTWVGEEGPEILDARRGSRILPKSAWGDIGGGGSEPVRLQIGVDGDSLAVMVDRRSRKVAVEEAAKGTQQALTHYRNKGFHQDFEKHAKNRRFTGGKGS